MNELKTHPDKYVPGPLHSFMNWIAGVAFIVGVFFFLKGLQVEDDVQDLKKAGVLFAFMAAYAYFSNMAATMKVEFSSSGFVRTRRFFGKSEIVEVPFDDIAETEVLPLSRNLKISLKSGKSLCIKRGIMERPGNPSENYLPYAELHTIVIERLRIRIEAGMRDVQSIKQA